ncbi:MAG: hypothetical protein ACLRX6_03790 [Limosilactobacillus pontis]
MLALAFATFVVAFTNLYFHILCIIKDRPVNFGRLRTIFY